MNSWEVTLITDSNYIKTVRVDNCITRKDAEAAALGMTGGKRVINSNPKTYKDQEVVVNRQESFNEVSHNYDVDREPGKWDGEIIFLFPMFILCMILWAFSPVLSCIVGALSIWFVIWCNK
jgi:hypothetical protein